MKTSIFAISLLLTTTLAYGAFSVDLPIVTHVQGVSTTFYTAIDITNHTSQPTDIKFEYISNDLLVDVGGSIPTLAAYGNFHVDDILTYLASQNFITTPQANGFGTLLITFLNASFTTGTEASATVRIYNFLTTGQKPSVGLAYRAIVLRKNGAHALTSIVGNTTGLTDTSPSLLTNVGIENVGIDDNGSVVLNPITVKVTFYDPRTGNGVGSQPTFTLAPGQLVQINDAWKSANLPSDANSLVMNVTETTGTAQIRGYVVVKDTNTNDGSFFFME